MSAITPIILLRQLADAAERDEPIPTEAGRWFARQFREYEALAPSGMTLDKAMGVAPMPGAGPWWRQDAREQRDEALRALFETCFRGQPVHEAARDIASLASRRCVESNPPSNITEQLIDAALQSGAKFPKPKRLAAILGNFTRLVEYRA